MSVEIIKTGETTWRVTATPNSGKAFWQVDVRESHRARNPLTPLLKAVRRAARIDKTFSLEAIEKRQRVKLNRRKALDKWREGNTDE